MDLQLSCQQKASCQISQKQNIPFSSFRVSAICKNYRNTLYELRNHYCIHPKSSSSLHFHVCLGVVCFFHGFLIVNRLLFPFKMCRLHAWPHPEGGGPIGYTWQSKYPSVCVHLQTVWESFHISDKHLAPQTKRGEGGADASPCKHWSLSGYKVDGISLIHVRWSMCFSART